MKEGDRVIVKTSRGWWPGVIDSMLMSGNVRIRVEKVYRGKRGYLPREATLIFPYMGRYGVVVAPADIRVSPFADNAAEG